MRSQTMTTRSCCGRSKEGFGAVEDGGLSGPYFLHQYVKLDHLRIGIVLDAPECLDLYALEPHGVDEMASLVARLLNTLNGQNANQLKHDHSKPGAAQNPSG